LGSSKKLIREHLMVDIAYPTSDEGETVSSPAAAIALA